MDSTAYDSTGEGDVFYFWKGRVALYAILKALGVERGDEVILPAFTCVAVPNAVLYAGATPVYADVDAETYNMTADTVRPLVGPRTKAILAQATFGLSADLDPIMEVARRHDAIVIEDCAQGLGGTYRGRPNGTIADAGFFSSQWTKPISTGVGGAAYIRNAALAREVARVYRQLPGPSAKEQALLAAQMLARPLLEIGPLYYPLVSTYRLLTQRLGMSVGSSSRDELETTAQPDGYAKRMGPLQRSRWQLAQKKLEAKVAHRRSVARRYDSYLATAGIGLPHRPEYARHAMLRYAVRVSDRARVLDEARVRRIPLGDWFGSPIHPVVTGFEQWGYEPGQCPVAETACNEVVNLFTDRPLSQRQLEWFARAA